MGVLFGSLGMAALAFGFGTVHVGLGQLCASTNSDGRLIAFALAAGGAFSLIDAAVWMLSGAGFDGDRR